VDKFISFGARNRFAFEVRLLSDPDGNERAPVSSIGSWGEWRIWVNGLNLCEHDLFLDGGPVPQDRVTWYVAPLVQWIATNWGPLLHEERLPAKRRSIEALRQSTARDAYIKALEIHADDLELFEPWQDWAFRHGVRWAGEGGLLPDLFLRRLGDDIELSWGARRHPGGDAAEFRLEPGVSHASVDDVGQALDGVLNWACEQLAFQSQSWFQEFRKMVHSRTTRIAREAFLAWHIDGASKAGPLTAIFRKVEDRSPRAHEWLFKIRAGAPFLSPLSPAAAMFGALSPEISETAAARLLGIIAEMRQTGTSSSPLATIARPQPAWMAHSPWDEGYSLAKALLEDEDFSPEEDFVDLRRILAALEITLRLEHLETSGPRGVALAGTGLRATIVVNLDHLMNSAESGRRFSVAHELCHVIYDRDRAQRVTHASTPWAPASVEQRANAFAAMLLMPQELLRRTMGPLSDHVSLDEIGDAARRMQVGLNPLIQHLANLGEIGDEARYRLLDELASRSGFH
jgi:hypothetical protein